jgi:putative permease
MRFLEVIGGWINRYFSHEEAIYLVALITACLLVILTLGHVLAPVLTGLVIAFLLQGLVDRLQRWHVPESLAVYITFLLFMAVVVGLILFIVPLMMRQLAALVNTLPALIDELQRLIRGLADDHPQMVSGRQAEAWVEMLNVQLQALSRAILEGVVLQVPSLVALIIYLVLVPLAVFFFLKDKKVLMAAMASILPRERPLLNRVGAEMNAQLANYVRGKFVEIVIVSVVTYLTFIVLGLNYAALLALLVGVSVLIPFIGAAVVTIPVAVVAYLQWGWSPEFAYVITAYFVIQALDGNVLVPLLFSEAVDLHPLTIIVAVLAFGGIWGFWGVFFAIPLATLVKAVFSAWPTQREVDAASTILDLEARAAEVVASESAGRSEHEPDPRSGRSSKVHFGS